MKLSRNTTNRIRHIMDDWLPPVLRDSPLLMKPLMRLFAGRHAETIFHLKSRALGMSPPEFADLINALISGKAEEPGQETPWRHTDINCECLARLLRDAQGESVLDAGCGSGFITEKLAEKFPRAVGFDLRTDIGRKRKAVYQSGDLTTLPFAAKEFDCVMCSHTIEHVLDLPAVIRELRRVARHQLIIITPKQRPYYATFDTHLHFFPYPHSLLRAIGSPSTDYILEVMGGDFYYLEEMKN